MHKAKIISDKPGFATILFDENELRAVRKLNINMEAGEIAVITAEIIPYENNFEIAESDVYLVVGDKKYRLMECVGDAFDLARYGFWVGETVFIDAADYQGNGKLIEQAGKDLFHVELEGKEGTYLYRRHEIKKIVGDAECTPDS